MAVRDSKRITQVLAQVERIWRKHPDWRLGQLLENVASWAGTGAWDMEEDELCTTIEEHLTQSGEPVESDR